MCLQKFGNIKKDSLVDEKVLDNSELDVMCTVYTN